MSSTNFHGGNLHLLYSEHDKPRVDDIFWLPRIMFQCMGQIPFELHAWLPKSFHMVGIWLAYFFGIFVSAFAMHLVCLFVKTFLDNLENGQLEDITDALTMVIIYSFSAYAIIFWLYRSRQLLEFLTKIQNGYRHHSLAGLTFVTMHESYIKARNISGHWYLWCLTGVLFWGLSPIVMGSRTLPLKCWYPFDELAPGVYEFIYATQLYGQIVVGITFGNGSALFMVLVMILLAQFDVLYCSLKNLDYHARLMTGEDLQQLRAKQNELRYGDQDELNQYFILNEHKTNLEVFATESERQKYAGQNLPDAFKHELHQALIECVHIHQFLLSNCDKLEELYNPYCLVKSLQVTIQLCLLVFVGVAGERTTIRVINQLQYLILTVLELLMFTYSGELLRTHSVRAGEAFFRSEWWQYAHSIHKDALIFLANSRRIVRVTAGKFYVMDLDRFRSVVTQAFSFLTLLQKLADKKKDVPIIDN